MQQRTVQPFPSPDTPLSAQMRADRLLINASELFWDWKFKGFKFCLVLVRRRNKSGVMLDSDTPWHLRQLRISPHGDMGANLSPDLCLFLMIELYNFQKWPLKSHCILQCVKLRTASTASWWNNCLKKYFNTARWWGSDSPFQLYQNPDKIRGTSWVRRSK